MNIFRNQNTKNPHNGTKSSAMIEANYLSSCTEIYFWYTALKKRINKI